MCIESSQHIVAILEKLKGQDLLGKIPFYHVVHCSHTAESFLPFDLEATFAAGMVLLLASSLDRELIANPQPWFKIVYGILDELILQNHLQAVARKNELQQLQQIFHQLAIPLTESLSNALAQEQEEIAEQQVNPTFDNPFDEADLNALNVDYDFLDETMWGNAFTADQLMTAAGCLDLDSIEWMTTGSSN